jgi:hypothetical protein
MPLLKGCAQVISLLEMRIRVNSLNGAEHLHRHLTREARRAGVRPFQVTVGPLIEH